MVPLFNHKLTGFLSLLKCAERTRTRNKKTLGVIAASKKEGGRITSKQAARRNQSNQEARTKKEPGGVSFPCKKWTSQIDFLRISTSILTCFLES